jgi:hypothetical protein
VAAAVEAEVVMMKRRLGSVVIDVPIRMRPVEADTLGIASAAVGRKA